MTKEESWEGQIKSPQPHMLGREAETKESENNKKKLLK